MRTSVDRSGVWYTIGVPVLWGVALGAVACLLLLLLMAAILTGMDTPSSAVEPMALAAVGVSGLIGGLAAGVIGGSRGWLLGTLTGLTLFVLTLLVGAMASLSVPFGQQLTKALLFVIGGLIGGVLGVNLRRR